MIRRLIENGIAKLAEGLRERMSAAVSDALVKGVCDGFAEAGVNVGTTVEIAPRPTLGLVPDSEPLAANELQRIPVQHPQLPNDAPPSVKRGRGRPRKFLNHDIDRT